MTDDAIGHHGSRTGRGNAPLGASLTRSINRWRPCVRWRTSSQMELRSGASFFEAALAVTPARDSFTDGPCHAGPAYASLISEVITSRSSVGSLMSSTGG